MAECSRGSRDIRGKNAERGRAAAVAVAAALATSSVALSVASTPSVGFRAAPRLTGRQPPHWRPLSLCRLPCRDQCRRPLIARRGWKGSTTIRDVNSQSDGGVPTGRYKHAHKSETAKLVSRMRTDVPADFNPLTEELNGLPRFDKVRPLHVTSAVDVTLQQFSLDLGRIQESLAGQLASKPWLINFQNLAEPLEEMIDRLDRMWTAVSLLREVNRTAADVDQKHSILSYRFKNAATILAQSDEIYDALGVLVSDKSMNEAQRRAVERLMREAWHLGVGVQDAETLRALDEGNSELAVLAACFARNVARDEGRVLRIAETREEVEGLSDKVLARAAAEANSNNASSGHWLLTSEAALCEQILEQAENRELRREAYLARQQLGSGGPQGGNEAVIAKMLELRRTWAHALGYGSYAQLAFESRMSTQRQAEMLLATLRTAAQAAADAEVKELESFAQSSGEKDRGLGAPQRWQRRNRRGQPGAAQVSQLESWDLPFWRARLRRHRLGAAAEDEALQPYLPLTGVLKGLFNLLSRLFGVAVVPATDRGEAPLWHRSVRFYRVVDLKTRASIAGFYLDPFRSERKRDSGGDFWADVTLSYSALLGLGNTPRRPVAHIVGDLEPRLEKSKPTLLSFKQVRSLFRAMGQAVQELLTNQEVGLMAGTKGLEVDFAAFPPRFLELWAYDPATLRSFGGHFESGDPMPEEMIQGIVSSQAFHSGSRLLDEVSLAKIDLDLHSKEESHDITSSGGKGLTSFSGPFSSGYAAGYFIGLWADVLAADAFEAFQEAEGEPEIQELGLRFREAILAPGGGRAPVDAYRSFRGRSPRVAALLRRLGLSSGRPETKAS